MVDVINAGLDFANNSYSNIVTGVNAWFPQFTGALSEIPFVGGLLSGLTNSDVVLILVFGLLFFYIGNISKLVSFFKFLFVGMILLILFGVI